MAISARIDATPSVIIRRVRSEPRRISGLVTKPSKAGGGRGKQKSEKRVAEAVRGEQPGGIGAEPEKGGVAERNDAGIAEDQVEREGEEREDRDVVDEKAAVGKYEVARRDGEPESGLAGKAGGRRSARCAAVAPARSPRVGRGEETLRSPQQHHDH